MRLSRCPICHSRIHLEALVQDEAGRELMAHVARLDTQTGAALVSYLGLFSSASRDLARETLALTRMDAGGRAAFGTKAEIGSGRPDTARLALALSETVEALRGGQPRQPLKNHNYLKKVFKSVQARPVILKQATGAHQFGAKHRAYGKTKRGAPISWGDIPTRPFLGVSDADKKTIQ